MPVLTTPALAKARKKRSDAGTNRYEYWVTKGGIPCRTDKSGVIAKRALLIQCKPGEALDIMGAGSNSRRKASRLITRSRAVATRVGAAASSSVAGMTQRMTDFLAPGDFEIKKRPLPAAPQETPASGHVP